MQNLNLDNSAIYFFIAIVVWTIPWKGAALWRSARNGQKLWFIFLLILNTLAILEIIYIFFFSKRKTVPSQTKAANQ